MFVEIKIQNNCVIASELYKALFDGKEKKTAFNVWFARRVTDYEFKEGKDFQSFLIESTGGRRGVDFSMSLNMAKELAMIERSPAGRRIREYFIECEEKLRDIQKYAYAVREIGKQERKKLTDKIKESGENERQKGHAFSNYTKMIYKKLGIDYQKQKDFRDTLTPEQLKDVLAMEKTIGGLIELGFKYAEIKNTLPDCIRKIENKLEGENNGA